ncbi:MAG: glycosyl hydrolase family 18 protein [Bacillota bacterium]|nr:glycosyl hydrolase family 18 protein [Bacillota bacterium]
MKKRNKLALAAALIFSLIMSPQTALAKTSNALPAAPSGLTASNISTSSITLKWNSVSGISGYYVYRATPNDSNYTKIATITSTSYTNTGLTANTQYWYFIKAYSRYGYSADSTHITAKTLSAATTTTTTSKKQVLGFTTYYYSGDTSSYNSMTANTSTIDEIATQTYNTDSLGNISGMVPTNQLTYANSNGIKAYAMVQNNFDGNIAKSVLESITNRQALENNLLSAVKANGYKGVNIDLEGVFYNDRSYYTTFVQELYKLLKPLGYSVTLSVPAKTSDNTTDSWSGAYDYAALSQYSDQIAIMTYDEHYPGGTAGPVASIGWVQNVVKYAVTVIPSSKIMLGVAAYGYDWSSAGTKAYGISGMYNLAASNGATVMWDDTSKSPYFNYTDSSGVSHSDWFENSQSVGYKLDLVNSYNLNGIAIWRLGLENTDYWTTIKTKFNR